MVKEEHDYRLGEEVNSTPGRTLNNNYPLKASGFLGESVTDVCQETGEYDKELENVPGFPLDNKTDMKHNVETETKHDRSNLFRALESSADSQDDHLSILTAELNINTGTLGDTDEPVQVTESGPRKKPAPSSLGLDAMTSLIETYKEAIKTDHTCSSCNMSVTNLKKHVCINKCELPRVKEDQEKGQDLDGAQKSRKGCGFARFNIIYIVTLFPLLI